MRRRPIPILLPVLALLAAPWLAGAAVAAEVVDSAGRTVRVPDKIVRVPPAGPPAAVLLTAIAPDLMIGWPGPLSAEARPLLAPAAAALDPVPRATGREDVAAVVYGHVLSPAESGPLLADIPLVRP